MSHFRQDPEEALQDRMVKMEAELTALREALSTRTDKKQEQVVAAANGSEKEATTTLQVQGVQGISQVQGLNGGNGDVNGGAQRLQIAE